MVDEERHSRITGKRLLAALTEAGIIRAGEYVRRVVIDIPVDMAVVVHVERYGDERLLRIARDLADHHTLTVLDDIHRQVLADKTKD